MTTQLEKGAGRLLTDIHSPDALAQTVGKGKEKGQCPEKPLDHTQPR